MKTFLKFALIAVLALGSAAAFAEKQSASLTINTETSIAGVKVPAGDYKIVVDRQGDTAKFTLLHFGKVVVDTNANFAPLSTFISPTAVMTGSKGEVTEIQVAKLKGSIVFVQDTKPAPAK